MIISHQKKFIFFACGKTGTTAIEAALANYHDGDDLLIALREDFAQRRAATGKSWNPKHARPENAKSFIPDNIWNNYFKFTFVRNPWDWVVSQHFSSKPEKGKQLPALHKFLEEDVQRVWDRKKRKNLIDEDESYIQYPFVYGRDGKKWVDFVGRYECLQEDFNTICQRLDIPLSALPVKNNSHHKPYQQIYTPAASDLVATLYKKDIDIFGYSFDDFPGSDFINGLKRSDPLQHR